MVVEEGGGSLGHETPRINPLAWQRKKSTEHTHTMTITTLKSNKGIQKRR